VKKLVLKQIRRGIILGLTISVPLSTFLYAKITFPTNPTGPAKIFYHLIDEFVGSELERRLQEEFNVDYEGVLNDQVILNLYHDFNYFKNKNEQLLEHLKKIVIIPNYIYESELVYPYWNYLAKANSNGSIEMSEDYERRTLTHELAHIKAFHLSAEQKQEFKNYFDWTEKPERNKQGYYGWNDGSDKPKNGFVRAYGALNVDECLATYVELFYNNSENYYFWKTVDKQNFDYTKPLSFLLREGFILQEHYDNAIKAMNK